MPHRRATSFGAKSRTRAFSASKPLVCAAMYAGVEPAFPQHHVQHAVEERDVAAGLDRQVQVGDGGGLGAARIDDDDLQRRVGAARVLDAAKQDRVRERGVRAGDEERRRVREVVVAARRRVGAERRLVAGDRARHAQARVGVDVVGADQALGELVEDVVVLGQELARDVERDRVGAVRGDRRGEAVGGEVERRVPADRLRRRAAREAPLRLAAAASASSPRASPSGAACCPCCTGARSWPDGRGRRERR